MRSAMLTLVVAALLAGCTLPEPAPGSPADGTQTGFAPPPLLHVEVLDIGHGHAEVRVRNNGDASMELRRDAWAIHDAAGETWHVDEEATAGLAGGFPETTTLAPEAQVEGTLRFPEHEPATPMRLVHDHDGHEAVWLLYANALPLELAAGDDTSFGSPIVLPRHGSLSYNLRGADAPVTVCMIDDVHHESWREDGAGEGYGCRRETTDAQVEVHLPAGTFNVAMYCHSDEAPCTFTLTVMAAW